MTDPTKILKSASKNNFLTGAFGLLLLRMLKPLFNLRVFAEDGTEFQVLWSENNLHIILKPIGDTTETPTGGMLFRGLWISGTQADYQNVFKVPTGSYAGVYVCVNPSGTALDPWMGVDWVMISQTSAIGNWT